MTRSLVAILLVPVGVLIGAWLGQYVMPATALGREFLINELVHQVGPVERAQLPASVYFFPTRLSLALALTGYAATLVIGAPLAALSARRGRFSFVVGVLLGGLIGAILAWIGASFIMSVSSAFGPQVVWLGLIIGAVAGGWYWLVAYWGCAPANTSFEQTRRLTASFMPARRWRRAGLRER